MYRKQRIGTSILKKTRNACQKSVYAIASIGADRRIAFVETQPRNAAGRQKSGTGTMKYSADEVGSIILDATEIEDRGDIVQKTRILEPAVRAECIQLAILHEMKSIRRILEERFDEAKPVAASGRRKIKSTRTPSLPK